MTTMPPTNATRTITVPRTGTAPLRFIGFPLASSSSIAQDGPAASRWFELSVYLSPRPVSTWSYVGVIGFRSARRGELPQDFAAILPDAGAVRDYFSSFDPCNPSIWSGQREGRPGDEQDQARARNEHNRNVVRAAYQCAVSELLDGDEFAEGIDEDGSGMIGAPLSPRTLPTSEGWDGEGSRR
jgi:hypothetical protein